MENKAFCPPPANTRLCGVDVLKIISMFMVVVLHILGHGGVLAATANGSANYHIGWILEICAYPAVNIFAMTTGYLMFGRKYKTARILSIWLQIFFYSIVICVLFVFLAPDAIGIKDWIKAVIPISSNLWWYCSCYFALLLVIPFLNKLLDILTRKQAYILVFILLCFSTLSTIFPTDSFTLNYGYTAAWLFIMYCIGAIIRKYNIGANTSKMWFLLAYFAAAALTWLSRICISWGSKLILGEEFGVDIFINYLSPLMVIMAASLLLFFIKIKLPKFVERCVAFLAPLSFAVYLIHEHNFVRLLLIAHKFEYLANANTLFLIVTVLGASLVIYAVCICIEYLRVLLFKLTGLNKVIRKLSTAIDNRLDLGL